MLGWNNERQALAQPLTPVSLSIMSGQIQTLLEAEKEAAKIVQDARQCQALPTYCTIRKLTVS